MNKQFTRAEKRRKKRQAQKTLKRKQNPKRGRKRMLRKIKIIKWKDKIPKRKVNPQTKEMEIVDEFQENDSLKLLNFIVNGMDPKNLPKGNIDQIRFWNRFEKAMTNAGLESQSQDSGESEDPELKEFIFLDTEAWKIIVEKGFKDLDPRIGRNQETFEALELIFEAEEYDPNVEEDKEDDKKDKKDKT